MSLPSFCLPNHGVNYDERIRRGCQGPAPPRRRYNSGLVPTKRALLLLSTHNMSEQQVSSCSYWATLGWVSDDSGRDDRLPSSAFDADIITIHVGSVDNRQHLARELYSACQAIRGAEIRRGEAHSDRRDTKTVYTSTDHPDSAESIRQIPMMEGDRQKCILLPVIAHAGPCEFSFLRSSGQGNKSFRALLV